LVGLNSAGTFSFGVLMSKHKSTMENVTTDSKTAKSPMIDRTYECKAQQSKPQIISALL